MNIIDIEQAIREIASSYSGSTAERGPFFFVAGAGISTPEVPLAEEIKNLLRKEIQVALEPKPRTQLEEWSRLFESAHPQPEQRREFFEGLIRGKPIPRASLRIARLLGDQGLANTLVTPNFDDFVVRALRLLGIEVNVYDRPEAISKVDWRSSVSQVVHVHGIYRDYDIANLDGEVQQNNNLQRLDLWSLLRDKSPLVLGYSGWSEDVIMTALRETLSGNPYLKHNLYWFCYTPKEASALPAWLINHRSIRVVVADRSNDAKTLDACWVLDRLTESLRLEAPEVAFDPLGASVRNLRGSLSKEENSGDWKDLYLFSQQVIGLFRNRIALSRRFHPSQIMAHATEKSHVFAAGRTLHAWATCFREILYFAEKKGLKFSFLMSAESAVEDLDERQQKEVAADRGLAAIRFAFLQEKLGTNFQVKETSHLILDGLTVAQVEGSFLRDDKMEMNHESRVICQFDINAAAGLDKPTLVLACTCGRDQFSIDDPDSQRTSEASCMTHGLYDRTTRLYRSRRSQRLKPIAMPTDKKKLMLEEQGLPSRKNGAMQFLGAARRIIGSLQLNPESAPHSPLCVQANIWAGCDTYCRMCDHWKENPPEEQLLDDDEWSLIFKNLKASGTKAIVLSGGEPLARGARPLKIKSESGKNKVFSIEGVVEAAADAGLQIGLLTSGLIEGDEERFNAVCKTLRKHVDWIAVSIDGTHKTDAEIRNPLNEFAPREDYIRRFCEALQGGPSLSATVTLQRKNITEDPLIVCSDIRALGIERVNFKFATGNPDLLIGKPKYLIDESELRAFFESLFTNPIANDEGNNLDYLRRCIARGVFSLQDIANGVPVQSYYATTPMRCFTPFLFSLIDSIGNVYPCCHLYRDNHGADAKSRCVRENNCLGNIRPSLDLKEVWLGNKYGDLRKRLETIDPKADDFTPCGECTRHVQPNSAMHALYTTGVDLEEGLNADEDLNPTVWF
jgi:MoaA/NifB/PqqE/SkfB family radical SAM enzyme